MLILWIKSKLTSSVLSIRIIGYEKKFMDRVWGSCNSSIDCRCLFFINYEREEKFVNPLFYKHLYAISKIAWDTTLTPISQFKQNPDDNKYYYKSICKTIKNNKTDVLMECTFYNPLTDNMQTDYYQYTITECDERCMKRYGYDWLVEERVFGNKDGSDNISFSLYGIDEDN